MTSISYKIVEHIHSSIMNHLDKYNILTKQQHDFLLHRSCDSKLALATHNFVYFLDKYKQNGVLMIDFVEAFHVVQQFRFIRKCIIAVLMVSLINESHIV